MKRGWPSKQNGDGTISLIPTSQTSELSSRPSAQGWSQDWKPGVSGPGHRSLPDTALEGHL